MTVAAEEDRLRTLDTVAERLGCSLYTARRYVSYQAIKAVHIGTRVMVAESEIQRIQRDGLPAIPLDTPRPRGRPPKKAAEAAGKESQR